MSGTDKGGSGLLDRRGFGVAAAGLMVSALAHPALARPALADQGWHDIDVSGSSAPLRFAMTRASDGKLVTQADYRGDVVLLYFGYTFCPDVCPLAMGNVAEILRRLGRQAAHVRVLFVTVDPDRDTLPLLKQYAAAFAPQIDALRGTPDALAALARRYRIAYSVVPASAGHPYEVTHSSAVYAFDAGGAARLLIPSLASQTPDIDGVSADLRRLVADGPRRGLVSRLLEEVLGLV